MKRMLVAIFVSLVLFTIGIYLSIVYPEVGLIVLIAGGIGTIVFSGIYLYKEYRCVKKKDTPVNYDTIVLPPKPVFCQCSDEFIYPDIYKHVPQEYKKIIASGSNNTSIEVCYQGKMVMQFINVPDVTNGGKENIGIFFYPYLYDDRTLIERFADNYYIHEFNYKIYGDEGTAAYFGKNVKKAMIVASYILSTVYYIPLEAQLSIRVEIR